ncbi:MAG TPA: UBP-type zinc finger domain-containing protein, partial [Nitrosopumilaceae archaeon]|nr:UBP-type zinc finger domain-containing protein [Nitrosopumilaceae archaeon]
MAEFDEKVFYAIISIAISAGIFFGVTYFLKKFFSGLKGIQKLTGLISLGIVAVEILYIGTSFDIFSLAIETIVAVGGAFWLLLIALQNHLKNISAGLSNYLNPEIGVGDMIEINAQKGIIVYQGLTKTTIMLDDGARIFVPNLKFTEELLKVFHKKQQCKHFKQITETASPKTQGCEECEKEGNQWRSLRMCLNCGHVGCDRSSPGKHAEEHFKKTKHPIIEELPEKRWSW